MSSSAARAVAAKCVCVGPSFISRPIVIVLQDLVDMQASSFSTLYVDIHLSAKYHALPILHLLSVFLIVESVHVTIP